MISTRMFVFFMVILKELYDYGTTAMADNQRKKPLPKEVADVYDGERYQKYFEYVADQKKLRKKYKLLDLVINMGLIFSPFFSLVESMCNSNPYLSVLVSFVLIRAVSLVPDTIAEYEVTFKLMGKYGLNKMGKKEFAKDTVLNIMFELTIMVLFTEILAFIGEHLPTWTNGFSIGYFKTVILLVGIVIGVKAFGLIAQGISYLMIKAQYTFTPLEDEELKEKIMKLQEGAKKKVKNIYIYNESKKTTYKNAFLLRLPWYTEFGIADNFIDENSEEELLAVLSHEIGHLKHKKNLFDYSRKAVSVLELIVIAYFMVHPEIVFLMNSWVRYSFGLTTNNYYVLLVVIGYVIGPIIFSLRVFDAYCSRRDEYEADREAVKNGYGEELIRTFKAVSCDEFINVNPHPFIEFTEYDHPGMYNRIKAIKQAEALYV